MKESLMSVVKRLSISVVSFFPTIMMIVLFSCTSQLADEEYEDSFSSGNLKPVVNKLVLVNAITQQDVGDLVNDYVFKAAPINIRAEAVGASVVFQLSGAESFTQTESSRPFALKGDNGGVYIQWIPTDGDYTLKVTPYPQAHGKGIPGESMTVKFKVSSNSVVVAPTTTTPGTLLPLYFEGNFSNSTLDLTKLYGWSGLDTQIQNQSFAFNGSTAHVTAKIVTYDNMKVLRAEVMDDDPTKSGQTRFQWSMFLKNKVEIIHFQYRVFLSPDIAELNNYTSAFNWFTLFEMWNDRATNMTAIGAYDGSARWNLGLHKDSTGKIYWAWDAEYMQPKEKAFVDMYPIQKNKTAEIPLGRWFLLDIYFNRNGKTVVMADNNVIFDFTGQNVYPGRTELYPAVNGNAVNVFKIYTSDPILDWMRGRGKKIWAMYNDLKWFKS